jgi:hypothetical protein
LYLININESGRSAGAYDREVIKANHDMDMLWKNFDGLKSE